MRYLKPALITFICAVAALTAIVLVRASLLGAGGATPPAPLASVSDYDGDEIAARLAAAIRFRTISYGDGRPQDDDAFRRQTEFLEATYPAAHAALSREMISGKSLLFRWAGTDTGEKPIGLMAHLDVVPIEAGTEDAWEQPPFDGVIEDGIVWGRGALDNKHQLIAIMEAVDHLAAEGFTPRRDIYLMFGHDEEIGGPEGAAAIVATLKSRGVSLAWTLDEGGGVAQGLIPGVEKPAALLAVAEKGSITLKFTATTEGGHSSTPNKDTAVSLISRAIVAVTDNPHPQTIDARMASFMKALGGELPFVQKIGLANLWLFGPVVKDGLAANPTTAAALHTTTAPTIISGGVKENILPQQASAVVNYRIHPSDTVEGVRARAIALIDDPRVTVETLNSSDPSPESSSTNDAYNAFTAATLAQFGDIPIAPFLTLQNTDTRHYIDIADDNYRFAPFIFEPADLERIHGTNERVRVDTLPRAAAWYEEMIRRTAGNKE